MQIDISPSDVERLVKDELVKAGLGKMIAEAVQKSLSGYNSPVDAAIGKYVGEVALILIRERFGEAIKTAVVAAIESKVTQDFINSVVDAATTRMITASERY